MPGRGPAASSASGARRWGLCRRADRVAAGCLRQADGQRRGRGKVEIMRQSCFGAGTAGRGMRADPVRMRRHSALHLAAGAVMSQRRRTACQGRERPGEERREQNDEPSETQVTSSVADLSPGLRLTVKGVDDGRRGSAAPPRDRATLGFSHPAQDRTDAAMRSRTGRVRPVDSRLRCRSDPLSGPRHGPVLRCAPLRNRLTLLRRRRQPVGAKRLKNFGVRHTNLRERSAIRRPPGSRQQKGAGPAPRPCNSR